jgi:hypothetical protein
MVNYSKEVIVKNKNTNPYFKNIYEKKMVEYFVGDGNFGLKEKSPFDIIIIGCAVNKVSMLIKNQLKNGGLIVAVVGNKNDQQLVTIEKIDKNNYLTKDITSVRFGMLRISDEKKLKEEEFIEENKVLEKEENKKINKEKIENKVLLEKEENKKIEENEEEKVLVPIKIFIKLNSETKILNLKTNLLKIRKLKKIILKDLNLNEKFFQIELKFANNKLENNFTIKSYNINEEDIIEAYLKKKEFFNYSEFLNKDFLCSFCLSILNEPKTLSCQHNFCSNCLNFLIFKYKIEKQIENKNYNNQNEINDFQCPICKKKNSSSLLSKNLEIEKKVNNIKKEILNIYNPKCIGDCNNEAKFVCTNCKVIFLKKKFFLYKKLN